MIDPPVYNPKTRKQEYKNPRLTPHCCRHTFASRAAAAGMRPDDLQKIIGHADYATTADIYVHQNVDTLMRLDDDKSLTKNCICISFSLGARRRFSPVAPMSKRLEIVDFQGVFYDWILRKSVLIT